MPVINGRYYMNPQYGAALEAARAADAAKQPPPQTRNAGGPARPRQVASSANTPDAHQVQDYLGQLADQYRLPRALVYAVAQKESSMGSDIKDRPNFETNHEGFVRDARGNKILRSTDHGLMQINDRTWFGHSVKDPNGKPFTIGEGVKNDWRANARAGVAILNGAYRRAKNEQGPTATDEDHAQQAYSEYNAGALQRDRYLKTLPNGDPADSRDRGFLSEYQTWVARLKQ